MEENYNCPGCNKILSYWNDNLHYCSNDFCPYTFIKAYFIKKDFKTELENSYKEGFFRCEKEFQSKNNILSPEFVNPKKKVKS